MIESKEVHAILADVETGEIYWHSKRIFPLGDNSKLADNWLKDKYSVFRKFLSLGNNVAFTSYCVPIKRELTLFT